MVVFGTDGKAVAVEDKPVVTEEKPVAETSSPAKPETSTPTYTEEQVAQREQKARSDALSDLGRIRAESERSRKAAEDALARLEKLQEAQRQAELEAAQDDPAELRRIKAEQETAKLQARLAERETELNSHREKVTNYEKTLADMTRSQTIAEIAKRLGIDAEKLTEASKFTDGSQTAIEGIANILPKATVKPPMKPDSNRSVGGSMSDDAIRQAYIANPTDPTIRPLYQEMRRRLGK
jgi:hypothetical protein